MAGAKDAGTMCQVLGTPRHLEDGTTCRCESPLPGPVGAEPSMWKQFKWGTPDASQPLGEEAWFENRYPNLLENARLKFVDVVNRWVQDHWGDTQFQDQKQRITVYARDEHYRNADGSVRTVAKSDNRFEGCGDQPQGPWEADKVLGAFSLDLETPFTITYSRKNVDGRTVRTFEWTAVMYVEDVLGLQKDNVAAQWPVIGSWLLGQAPSRRVKRATWNIHGDGVSAEDTAAPVRMHMVVSGDTLAKLADTYYGDARLWPILYAVNREAIGGDPDMLRPGFSLRVPDLDELSPSEKERAMSSAPVGGAHGISGPPLR